MCRGDLRRQQPAGGRSGEPDGSAPGRVHRQSCPRHGFADQRHGARRLSGHAAGRYWNYAPLGRATGGFAWDINGDGKQALRTSARVFYAIPQRENWENFVGDPPSSFTRVVQWASLSDIENFATSNIAFVETPVTADAPGGEQRSLEKSYNVNVTYQRDIGFNTTAEVAYVGAFTNAAGRLLDINRPVNALYMFGNPNNLFNGNALDTNFLRTAYPGMGGDQQVDRSENGR